MTGREKIEAAFSAEGTDAFAAVTCYQRLFLRGHWEEATDAPWWALHDPDPKRAARPFLEMVERTGEDWFLVMLGASAQQQEDIVIETDGDDVFRANRATGERTPLYREPTEGVQRAPESQSQSLAHGISDPDELLAIMDGMLGASDAPAPAEAQMALPRLLLDGLGGERAPLSHATSPWWHCFSLWGFGELMIGMVEHPQLVHRACERFLQYTRSRIAQLRAMGVRVVWIEDCMSDMIRPEQCREFSTAYLRQVTDAIRQAGMLSVHYYCGQPGDRWDLLLDTGADALALEESKKTFDIDIMDVADRVDGRMALLGNIDAIGVMEAGSDERLRAEVARQCEAGKRNRGRFIVSIGSPVTPGTPLQRVRRYCDLVHEISPG